MAGVRLAPGVIDGLDRIVERLQQHETDAAGAGVTAIISALDVLADNPLIGPRPATTGASC